MSVQVEVYRERRKNTFLVRWFINFLAILLTAKLLHGVVLEGMGTALLAAFILGIVNTVIKPILFIFSLPLTIVTLGLFTFVINALMLLLVAWVIPGFAITTFWTAFFGAILISIFSAIISAIFD